MHFCILAAGEGSRMSQEGVSVPKPLVTLDGKPMIGRLMDQMVACHAETISIIVNAEMKEVAAYIRNYAETAPIPIRLLVKSTPSSMHSFYELSNMIEGDKFVLTTVDTIFLEKDMEAYINAFEQEKDVVAFMAVTRHIDDEKPLYVDVDEDMRITGFLDAPSAQSKFVSGGIYGLTPAAIEVVRQCIKEERSRMRNFQRELLCNNRIVKAWDFGTIQDVDHAEDIEKAQRFINQNK